MCSSVSNIESFLEQKVEATHHVLHLDLFSMYQSKKPDLCIMHVDRLYISLGLLYET
jgi:hypothetical protein